MENNINFEIKNLVTNKPHNYWDFSFRNKTRLEKLIKYPAKMASDMQKELMEFFVKTSYVESICDPFMGSGTILDLAINLGVKNIYGNDLNPYSFLINKYKFAYKKINKKRLDMDLAKFIFYFKNLNKKEIKIHSFNKIYKWFRQDVVIELSKIRTIIYEKRFYYKKIFKLAFINVIKDFSNDRKSTSKLHTKKPDEIKKINPGIIYFKFLKYVRDFAEAINTELSRKFFDQKINLFNENILKISDNIMKKSIDLIITSPPYGDNKTTISYGQFSMLPLLWLDKIKKSHLLENYSKIDSDSLGGTFNNLNHKLEFLVIKSKNFEKLYLNFENKKSFKKVIAFLYDFYFSLKNIDYILKENGYLILTLGNRRVHNTEIPLDIITIDFLNAIYKYDNITNFQRNIPTKTIPNLTSKVNGKSVKSISRETILIFQKKH